MYRIIFLLALVLLVFGCSSEGNIKVINRTEHNLFFTAKNDLHVIDGESSFSLDIGTGTRFLFLGSKETGVDIALEGETFMMQEAINGVPTGDYFLETTVFVEPNKTTKLYCDPTHAGVKLVNNSSADIISFSYFTNKSAELQSLLESDLSPQDSVWSRLKATTASDSIIYSFIIEGETVLDDSTYQDINWLEIDEQLKIVWE